MLIPALLLMIAPQDMAAANDADLKCMALSSILVSQAPEAERGGLIGGLMFFYGKLSGRSPEFDVEGAMLRLMTTDREGKALQAEALRCAQEMQKRGTDLTEMGKRVSAAAAQ